MTRVAAGAFGFLTFIQVLDGPERYGVATLAPNQRSAPRRRRA